MRTTLALAIPSALIGAVLILSTESRDDEGLALMILSAAALVSGLLIRHDHRVDAGYASLRQVAASEREQASIMHRMVDQPSGPQPLGKPWMGPFS